MIKRKSVIESLVVLIVSLAVIVILDLWTNRLQIEGHAWDFVYYIDMAENGVIGNPNLGAPYAYRALTPLLARAINHLFGLQTFFGFKILAYLGLWSTLFFVYHIARELKAGFGTGLLVMLVPACALFNVKFLLFDPYRPDQLAYPLLALGFLALLKDKPWVALAASAIGLQTREFPIIPALIIVYEAYTAWRAGGSLAKFLRRSAIVAVVLGLAVGLPRALIHVKFTQQILDPFNNPNFLRVLFGMPFQWKRDFNYLFNLIAYFLPVVLLATPKRLGEAWLSLGRVRVWIIIHVLVVLVFMMYGGTDMMRYATYLFIPQVILITVLLRQSKVHWIELLVMFGALILFNRLLFLFPIWDFSAYINFYGGYGDWVNESSIRRLVELGAYILVAALVRMAIHWRSGRASSEVESTSISG